MPVIFREENHEDYQGQFLLRPRSQIRRLTMPFDCRPPPFRLICKKRKLIKFIRFPLCHDEILGISFAGSHSHFDASQGECFIAASVIESTKTSNHFIC